MNLRRALVISLLIVLASSLAVAQSWRGMARMTGKVTDEEGKPLEGVVVKLALPAAAAWS